VQLFRRLPRGVELTAEGLAFRRHAQIAWDASAAARDAARRAALGEEGSLTIGFTGSASFNPNVTASIATFRQAHVNLHLTLVEHPTSRLIEELRARRVDVAFLRPTLADEALLTVVRLPDEPLRLVLPATHRLAGMAKVDLASVASDPFVLYPRVNGPLLYDAMIAACARSGFSPTHVQEAPQLTSVVTLVAAGLGVALIPASICQLHAQGVAHADLLDTLATAPLALARRADLPSSPASDNFLRHVRASLAQA
jgi:DNA-binding transcriptional LysR family regulator